MNKALSWTLGGSGYDAREAARETARREGKSLGEWLHGVIAEEAEGSLDPDRGPAREDRITALTTRLERMGAAAARGRRVQGDVRMSPRGDRDPSFGRLSRDLQQELSADSRPHRVVDGAPDRAIEAEKHAAERTGRYNDDALASLAKLLESSERRRESERADVATLADKLAAIDARLAERDHNPVKGTLARLEARIEQIGRRSQAEADARLKTMAGVEDPADPMRRLEEKLNAVLQAVVGGPKAATMETSSIALAAATRHERGAAKVELPLRRRGLGEAIADIAQRQRLLDTASGATRGGASSFAVRPIETRPASDALADLSREIAPSITVTDSNDRLDFESLRKDISAMAEQLRELAPRRSVTAIENQISQLESRLGPRRQDDTGAAIDGLRADIQAIGGRIDAMACTVTPMETTVRLQSRLEALQDVVARRPALPAGADLSALEGLVNELGRRIEAVQSPGAGQPALDALQRQVGALASRLESTETGLKSLATVERSMRDLFARLEDTRGFAETAAARAAQEALRVAVAEKGFDRPAPRADIAVLKAMQEDADLRTRATLDVVHETLDKVVDRLAAMEQNLAADRSDAARSGDANASYRTTRPAVADLALGAAEPLLDPPEAVRRPPFPQTLREGRAKDASPGTSDFIAAARRAAHAAQSDPAVVAMRDGVSVDESAIRAGLLAKSRDFVASHKRPVLLALAAVLVVAATMALVQRLPGIVPGVEIAQNTPATRTVSSRQAAAGQIDAMAPSTLPHSTPALAAEIPGSDPIATGSIPSLPAFAAGAATPGRPPAPPALPGALVRMAEAGDGAAAYTLATAYAEGRGVPRDFQRAAKLYAAAVDKGIVPAQYRLGALYEKGLGVEQDKMRARALYRKAADAGNPRAMHNLAVLLADGDGKPDYEGAATWFRKAAQFGVHDSQYNLAILLARGLGVEPSLVQSYQWFAIAAAQGDADAAAKRDEVGSKLGASELSVAKALAAAFHPRIPDPAALEVAVPPGGWDGATAPVHLNSARSKIS